MGKFRIRPVVIEAVQFFATRTYTPEDGSDIIFDAVQHGDDGKACIDTIEGRMSVSNGDWIIKGTKGDFWSCGPARFEKMYEAV